MSAIFRNSSFGIAAALLGISAAAGAAGTAYGDTADTTPSAEAMGADLLIVRPLGIAATALGSALFVVGLPFEAASGNIDNAARRLVKEPAQFTFVRPLGDIH